MGLLPFLPFLATRWGAPLRNNLVCGSVGSWPSFKAVHLMILLFIFHLALSNNSGFMLILHSFAKQPLSCRKDCTPSRIRIWVKPISLMNSSFECSESVGIVLVTRNIVLMMSCDEYPRSLVRGPCQLATRPTLYGHFHPEDIPTYHNSLNVSTALSILPSQQALIIACTLTGCGLSTTRNTLSPLTNPNPAHVLCRLLMACRISPSAENTRAAKPSSE